MRLALEVWGSDAAQVVATARRAEDLGFDGFYYGEAPTGLNLDCWTMLAALAGETERIRIGPVITNVLPDLRSLALLGKQAATVAVLSGGRLDFRTGVGAAAPYGRAWWEPLGVTYGDYGRRHADLDHALGLLPAYWADEPVELVAGGGEIRLGIACPPIPVTVAATGPRGLAVAATHGQVWEASFRTPDEYARLDTAFRAVHPATPTARPAGPDTGAAPGVGTGPVLRSLEVDALVGTTAASAAVVAAAFDRDRAGEDLSALRSRALVGEPSAAAERLAALAEAGVDQVVIAAHDPHDPDALEALALARSLIAR